MPTETDADRFYSTEGPRKSEYKENTLRLISEAETWQNRLQTSGNPPHPKPILVNCTMALRHAPEWSDALAFNEMRQCVVVMRVTPWGAQPGHIWTDHDDSCMAEWFQFNDIVVPTHIASEAVKRVAREHTYNPVIDYLTSVEWDGKPRIHDWLTTYFGALPSDYSEAISKRWLVSAVARVYDPGCKADSCLILEGAQGLGKSSGLQELVGRQFFTDNLVTDLSSKEAAIGCQSAWVIEFSELEGIANKGSRIDAVKSFLSRTHDDYRPHYGRHNIQVPRRCVFAATTNQSLYLGDETGNRRFWPVYCYRIDREGVKRDRDQLWAEAKHRYFEGWSWWLNEEEDRWAQREQDIRYEPDAWESKIAAYLKDRRETSTTDILNECLEIPHKMHTRSDQMRAAKCMKRVARWIPYKCAKTGMKRYRRIADATVRAIRHEYE